MNGALLIHKHDGISSFGVIEALQKELRTESGLKRKDLPKLGHGGTLDPFATGLLVVLVGKGVKLSRYFLGSVKTYEGEIRFGETTIPGDPTAPISETSDHIPASLNEIQDMAHRLTLQPYLQTPPMHSAKKKDGKPLYELAREGIEIEREPKLCHLSEFKILSYENARARFRVQCSSGTYIRVLAQDLARHLGSVALLESLHRTNSGVYSIQNANTLPQIIEAMQNKTPWDQLPYWVPFDRLLDGYLRADATEEEHLALIHGKQQSLFNILRRTQPSQSNSSAKEDCVAIYSKDSLIAIARKENELWGIERVFVDVNG